MIAVIALRSQDPKVWGRVVFFLPPKVLKHTEHTAALHVMSVHNRVWVSKIAGIQALLKNRTRIEVFSAECLMEIVLVVCRMADRIINIVLSIDIEPAHNVWVNGFQILPVDLDRRLRILDDVDYLTFLRFYRLWRGRWSRGAVRLFFPDRFSEFIRQSIILGVGGSIAVINYVELIGGIQEHTECCHEQDCSNYPHPASSLFLLFFHILCLLIQPYYAPCNLVRKRINRL